MKITKTNDGNTLTVCVEGSLDTNTAPDLNDELKVSTEGINRLIFDLSKLTYVSSAGLRVFISAHKLLEKQGGSMMIKHPTEEVMEIFDMTGFSGILNIEV